MTGKSKPVFELIFIYGVIRARLCLTTAEFPPAMAVGVNNRPNTPFRNGAKPLSV